MVGEKKIEKRILLFDILFDAHIVHFLSLKLNMVVSKSF
jgi:hypothetical protein